MNRLEYSEIKYDKSDEKSFITRKNKKVSNLTEETNINKFQNNKKEFNRSISIRDNNFENKLQEHSNQVNKDIS